MSNFYDYLKDDGEVIEKLFHNEVFKLGFNSRGWDSFKNNDEIKEFFKELLKKNKTLTEFKFTDYEDRKNWPDHKKHNIVKCYDSMAEAISNSKNPNILFCNYYNDALSHYTVSSDLGSLRLNNNKRTAELIKTIDNNTFLTKKDIRKINIRLPAIIHSMEKEGRAYNIICKSLFKVQEAADKLRVNFNIPEYLAAYLESKLPTRDLVAAEETQEAETNSAKYKSGKRDFANYEGIAEDSGRKGWRAKAHQRLMEQANNPLSKTKS